MYRLLQDCSDTPASSADVSPVPAEPDPISPVTQRIRNQAGQYRGFFDSGTLAALRQAAASGAALDTVAHVPAAAAGSPGTSAGSGAMIVGALLLAAFVASN